MQVDATDKKAQKHQIVYLNRHHLMKEFCTAVMYNVGNVYECPLSQTSVC